MTFVLANNLHTKLILMERVEKKTVRERERETARRSAGTHTVMCICVSGVGGREGGHD